MNNTYNIPRKNMLQALRLPTKIPGGMTGQWRNVTVGNYYSDRRAFPVPVTTRTTSVVLPEVYLVPYGIGSRIRVSCPACGGVVGFSKLRQHNPGGVTCTRLAKYRDKPLSEVVVDDSKLSKFKISRGKAQRAVTIISSIPFKDETLTMLARNAHMENPRRGIIDDGTALAVVGDRLGELGYDDPDIQFLIRSGGWLIGYGYWDVLYAILCPWGHPDFNRFWGDMRLEAEHYQKFVKPMTGREVKLHDGTVTRIAHVGEYEPADESVGIFESELSASLEDGKEVMVTDDGVVWYDGKGIGKTASDYGMDIDDRIEAEDEMEPIL